MTMLRMLQRLRCWGPDHRCCCLLPALSSKKRLLACPVAPLPVLELAPEAEWSVIPQADPAECPY